MQKLTVLSKLLITGILIGSGVTAYRTYGGLLQASTQPTPSLQPQAEPGAALVALARPAAAASVSAASSAVSPRQADVLQGRPLRVALSQWPGHMALLVGAGGLRTQPGSIAAKQGLDVEIVFIEDAPSKNRALQTGEVDFVWQTIDELPIALSGFRAQNLETKAFLQIDWSRGGDACVASKEVQKVEDIWGRKSAVLMFSPDHTVFEFMITNSRLTRQQVSEVRKATKFSPDDFTYARVLFEKREIDVACLWEPDVTLALASRPGAHRSRRRSADGSPGCR